MKQYPTIKHYRNNSDDVYAFDKLDGSNIRAEWSSKKGFWKFGSRKVLLDESHDLLGESVGLIKNWTDDLTPIFNKQRWQKVICFFEYHGESSIFGRHKKDEFHRATLIDVSPYKQPMLPPKEFVKLFVHLDIPRVLYRGKVNSDFVLSVIQSTLEGMTCEGVVCKGTERKKKFSAPVMFKIKTNVWLEKLKEYCKSDMKLFKELY